MFTVLQDRKNELCIYSLAIINIKLLQSSPHEFAKMLMPACVRRGHSLKFTDRIAGLELASASSPSSDKQQAPFKDNKVRLERFAEC